MYSVHCIVYNVHHIVYTNHFYTFAEWPVSDHVMRAAVVHIEIVDVQPVWRGVVKEVVKGGVWRE